MTAQRQGYRGYVTSREFGGLRIPVPVQSLVLRDYCARKKLLYKLHVNENMFPHSYLVLEGLVQDLSGLEGILMCSMYMLPRRASRRRELYRRILEQGADLHFVLEDVAIRKPADIEPVEDILAAVNWLPQSPTRIPDELIGPAR
jgi:sporadic carbohydrate cluster protein (TIGR04323 family)